MNSRWARLPLLLYTMLEHRPVLAFTLRIQHLPRGEDMKNDEELLALSAYRDLWMDWRSGVLTLAEAAFLARRCEFETRLIDLGVPRWLRPVAAWLFDYLFEDDAIAGT
ncbi:MAG: hypothetical protein WA208_18595 [Thermoanaerobaculia bacterium]